MANKFDEIESLYDNYSEIGITINKKCEEFIKSMLRVHGDCVLDSDKNDEDYLTVTYDGGNHPEYASNLYSKVERIYLNEEGEIALDIEDTEEYPFDALDVSEVYYTAEVVANHKF